MNAGGFLPLPGKGKAPDSSLEPLATTTHPIGGFAVQSCIGALGSGSRRSSVAACTPVVLQKSTTLPLRESEGFVTTVGRMIFVTCPPMTFMLLSTAYVLVFCENTKS